MNLHREAQQQGSVLLYFGENYHDALCFLKFTNDINMSQQVFRKQCDYTLIL